MPGEIRYDSHCANVWSSLTPSATRGICDSVSDFSSGQVLMMDNIEEPPIILPRDGLWRPRDYIHRIMQLGFPSPIISMTFEAEHQHVFNATYTVRCQHCGAEITRYASYLVNDICLIRSGRQRFFLSRCLEMVYNNIRLYDTRFTCLSCQVQRARGVQTIVARHRSDESYCKKELIQVLDALDEKHQASRRR